MPLTRHVLVVEDHDDIRMIVSELLAFQGMEVVAVADGRAAIAAARAHEPCVAIVDLFLGEGPTGIDVARELRADPRLAPMRIVGISASGDLPNLRARALDAGFDEVLTKPVEGPEIVRIARDAVSAC